MAAKRTASSDLNHENWDQDDEREEAGEFSRAPDDVIKRRVIKTARRRNPISTDDESTNKAFGSFSGFAKVQPSTSTAFSFLNNLNKDNDTAVKDSSTANGTSILAAPGSNNSTTKKLEASDDYLAKLKGLNESVSSWIKNKVDQNPFVNLKPIFKDYEKYFDELEEGKEVKKDDSKFNSQLTAFTFKPAEQRNDVPKPAITPQFSFGSNSKSNENRESEKSIFTMANNDGKDEKKAAPMFSFINKGNDVGSKPVHLFGSKAGDTEEKPLFSFGNKESTEIPKFSFGSSTTATTSPSAPMFSFGSNNTATTASSTFSFGSGSTSFATSSIPIPSIGVQESKNEDDEEEPPKNEFTPVVEDGHIYSTKCKVFVKNDGAFGDRGIGTLFLKPVPESEKMQLIVRADTSLGNLLCNFILSKGIPTKRMGKKDVMLVCLPTPDTKPPPVPVLLRVKSPEEADELLTELEKHKK